MKNLVAVIVFLIVIALLVKYGMDRFLDENQRHNKFLEDRIDRDGLNYILSTTSETEDEPEIVAEPVPIETDDPEAELKDDPEVKVNQNGHEPIVADPGAKEAPRYLDIDKVSEAAKIIMKDWQLISNKEFIKDLTSKTQTEFVNEYINDILGEQIRIQFGLSSKKGSLYKYYKDKGVKKAEDMSKKVLIQLYKFAKGELKSVK